MNQNSHSKPISKDELSHLKNLPADIVSILNETTILIDLSFVNKKNIEDIYSRRLLSLENVPGYERRVMQIQNLLAKIKSINSDKIALVVLKTSAQVFGIFCDTTIVELYGYIDISS